MTAFFATLVLAWALRHMLPSPDAIHWMTAGLVAALGGSLGDLVLAVVRRDLGIKDTGAFILGRSDVLDRMDRLIFVAPLYFYSQRFIEGLG